MIYPETTFSRWLRSSKLLPWVPTAAAVTAGVLLCWWLSRWPSVPLIKRVPGTDHAAGAEAGTSNPILAGKVIKGDGVASSLPGTWLGFRGNARDGVNREAVPLRRSWDGPPRQAWTVELGEGYAGAAVCDGRVYVMDYDREKKQDALRCLSLADGKEIWRYAYPVFVKRNHGMSRTVPVISSNLVVAMGPKCHVVCVDAQTGELRWGLDLVRQFGATVPPWYAGQCPLIDGNTVIIAPGGKDALLIGVDLTTGKLLWQTPNPKNWKMTHSSVMPMDFGGQRQYIYAASLGVVGVSAKDGTLLWESPDWKISIATVPSPVVLENGRIFLSGGYNAGSVMLQLTESNGQFTPKSLFRLDAEVFGATQHTPSLYEDHLYAVRADGQFVCLDLDGKVLWTSGSAHQFGLGSFLVSGGLIFALNDSGTLTLLEASPARFNLLGQAQVLHGRESWAPMALAGGRLLVRDLTQMTCLEVGQP